MNFRNISKSLRREETSPAEAMCHPAQRGTPLRWPKLFLDFDGVLIDASDRSYALYKDILERKKIPALRKNAYMKMKCAKKSIADILTYSDAESELKYFLQEWIKLIESPRYIINDKLFPDARRTLECLQKRFKLFLITLRKNKSALYAELKRFNIRKYFTTIIVANEGAYTRHASKIAALAPYAGPGDIIIGDTETDIRAGKKLSMSTVALTTGFRSRRLLLKEKPDYIATSFDEIPSIINKIACKSR